jgi:amidase
MHNSDNDTGLTAEAVAAHDALNSATASAVTAEVTAAVRQYDEALAKNDLVALRDWFDDSPGTLRADGQGVLVGRGAIDQFRRTSGGARPRKVRRLHVVLLHPGAAVAVAETVREDGVAGVQTQVWVKRSAGWRISVAHVSTSPDVIVESTSEPGLSEDDKTLWRVRGEPLVRGADGGRLQGLTVAVKDLFAVAGHRIGAGNPAWLAEAPKQCISASPVRSLLAEGADVTGIVQTDEFAYSLGGTNVHYGTPTNPAAPNRVPGGSSSGPASAVALGLVHVGLGTDTAGSIRVPASYCGLFGFRPSHGLVPTDGVLALAPSFDTVGWLTRDASTLQRVADVLLPQTDLPAVERLLLAEDVLGLAEPAVQQAVRRHADDVSGHLRVPLHTLASLCEGQLDSWLQAFRLVQAAEAWRTHGAWLSRHPGALEPEIADRFAQGEAATAREHSEAERVLIEASGHLRDHLPPGTALVQPATSTPAPPVTLAGADKARMRAGTLRLTCLASLAGLPVLTLPGPVVASLPVGLCLVGSRGSDAALTALAATAAAVTPDVDRRTATGAVER